jgi:hypothetical protein
MPFFKPPANTLAPYQLELLASIFREAWTEIVPTGYRLPQDEERRLQSEISARLCWLAGKGLGDPVVLRALTVATVRLQPRKMRRRSLTENERDRNNRPFKAAT